MTSTKKIDLSTKISRKEIADHFGITVNSVRKMCDAGRLPDKPVFIKHTAYYDKSKIKAWMEHQPKIRKTIDKKRKALEPFIYNDNKRKIILFCQPALLNRLSY